MTSLFTRFANELGAVVKGGLSLKVGPPTTALAVMTDVSLAGRVSPRTLFAQQLATNARGFAGTEKFIAGPRFPTKFTKLSDALAHARKSEGLISISSHSTAAGKQRFVLHRLFVSDMSHSAGMVMRHAKAADVKQLGNVHTSTLAIVDGPMTVYKARAGTAELRKVLDALDEVPPK
jgi:hypothetical protein